MHKKATVSGCNLFASDNPGGAECFSSLTEECFYGGPVSREKPADGMRGAVQGSDLEAVRFHGGVLVAAPFSRGHALCAHTYARRVSHVKRF